MPSVTLRGEALARDADHKRRRRLAPPLSLPAARRTLVRPAEEGERSHHEYLQIEAGRPVLHVRDVELDPLVPWERGSPVHLRPARDAGLHLEPPALPVAVALDLVSERRTRPDDAHV